MLAYVVLATAFAFVIGMILILDRAVGKRVDRLVNSLPLSRQIILGIVAAAVLTVLLVLFGS